MGKMTLTFRDYGEPGEKSTCQFPGPDMTSGNFDAELTLQNTLRDATQAIVLGTLSKRVSVAVESPQPDTQPASPFAQRETKWLVRYRNTLTGEKASLELPCADLQFLDGSTVDKADLTGPEMAAFVAAFEAYVLTPGTGVRDTNMEIYEIVHVGRNF